MKKEVIKRVKNVWMLLLAGILTLGLQSCDDDDNNDNVAPSTELQAAFSARFPGVDPNRVEWEWDGRMNAYEADFWENSLEKSAWFSEANEWLMTETDYNYPYTGVPQAVIDAANASNPDYRLEDIDLIETPDGSYYLVEKELGERDIYLSFAADGTPLS